MDPLEEAVLFVDDDVEFARPVSEELPGVGGAEAGACEFSVPFLYLGVQQMERHGRQSAKQRLAVVELLNLLDRVEGGHIGGDPGVAVSSELAVLQGLVLEGEGRILRIPVHHQDVLSGRYRRTESPVHEVHDAEGGEGLVGFQWRLRGERLSSLEHRRVAGFSWDVKYIHLVLPLQVLTNLCP